LVLYYSKQELFDRDLSWNNVSRYKRIEEQVLKDASDQWEEWHYDGKLSETGKRTGFKQAAARVVRRANKRLAVEILSGLHEDGETSESYPHVKLGKALAWNFW
tara:strand:- start:1788 stop:2099 length:312 start_codon:yes stop_codon:yes gene_type:complete